MSYPDTWRMGAKLYRSLQQWKMSVMVAENYWTPLNLTLQYELIFLNVSMICSQLNNAEYWVCCAKGIAFMHESQQLYFFLLIFKITKTHVQSIQTIWSSSESFIKTHFVKVLPELLFQYLVVPEELCKWWWLGLWEWIWVLLLLLQFPRAPFMLRL